MNTDLFAGDIRHGPKPAEEWTHPERVDAICQLSEYGYVPINPPGVDYRRKGASVENRILWNWTEQAATRAIVSEWPD